MSYEGSGFDDNRPVDADHKAETNWRLIAGGVIATLLLVFIVINGEDVEVDFLVTQVSMPLWLVIAATTLLGVAVGYLLAGRRHRRRARAKKS